MKSCAAQRPLATHGAALRDDDGACSCYQYYYIEKTLLLRLG